MCIVISPAAAICWNAAANQWGYKPLEESMHPYYYSCPLSIWTSHRSSPPTGVQAFAPTTHGGAHPRLSRHPPRR